MSKKLINLAVMAMLILSIFGTLSFSVSGAELCAAPWEVYFSNSTDLLETAGWTAKQLKFDTATGNPYYGDNQSGDYRSFVVRTSAAGTDRVIRTRTDNSAYRSVIVGFSTPYASKWTIEANLVNSRASVSVSLAPWVVSTAPAGNPTALTTVQNGNLKGNSSTSSAWEDLEKSYVNASVDLEKGDKLYFAIYLEANVHLLSIPSFTVTDSRNAATAFDMFDIGTYTSFSQGTKTYRPADYKNIGITAGENIWSVYNRAAASYNISDWVSLPLSAAKDTAIGTDGARDGKSGNTDAGPVLKFPVFAPDSTFLWQPWDSNDSPKGGGAFGWTAPYTGNWVVYVKAYHRSSRSRNLTTTGKFQIGYKADGSNDVTTLFERNMPGNSTGPNTTPPNVYERELLLSVTQGETVYLLANAATDCEANFQYIVSDADNPSIVYDASKISNNHMINARGEPSPFTFGQAADRGNAAGYYLETYYFTKGSTEVITEAVQIADARKPNITPLDLYAGDNYLWTNNPDSYNGGNPILAITPEDKLLATTRTSAKSPAVMFTAPEDGHYSFDLVARNIAATPVGTGVFYLYRTGGPRTPGEDWYITGGHLDEDNYRKDFPVSPTTVEWHKLIPNLKKGETLILISTSKSYDGKTYEMDLSVSKINNVTYDYKIGGNSITAFAQIAAAENSTLSLSCNLLDEPGFISDTAVLILGIYDSDGHLVSVDISDETPLAGDNNFITLTADVKIPAGIEGGKVQALIWSDYQNIIPLVDKSGL
jgi:hypothetical protein